MEREKAMEPPEKNARRAIEERVEDGCVLNSEGRWVHMFEQLTNEQRVIDELARGNVSVNGIWVRIADARKWAAAPKKTGTVSSAHPPTVPIPLAPPAIRGVAVPEGSSTFEGEDNFLETISMDAMAVKQIAGNNASPKAVASGKKGAGAPKAAAPKETTPITAPAPSATAKDDLLTGNATDETDSFDAGLIGKIISAGNAEAGAAKAGSIAIDTTGESTETDFSGRDDLRETAVLMIERANSQKKKGS